MRFLPLTLLAAFSFSLAQTPPQLVANGAVNPQADAIRATACTVEPEPDGEPRSEDLPTRQTPEWRAEYALRRAYNALFPEFLAAVASSRASKVPSAITTRPGRNLSVAGFGVASVWMNMGRSSRAGSRPAGMAA